MIAKPATFEHFPVDRSVCPVCNTNEDSECVLLAIPETKKDGICEAIPVHLWCAMATSITMKQDILYRKIV